MGTKNYCLCCDKGGNMSHAVQITFYMHKPTNACFWSFIFFFLSKEVINRNFEKIAITYNSILLIYAIITVNGSFYERIEGSKNIHSLELGQFNVSIWFAKIEFTGLCIMSFIRSVDTTECSSVSVIVQPLKGTLVSSSNVAISVL